MKTIDEILKRDDYKVVNNALVDRSIEIAENLLEACLGLDLDDEGCFRLGGMWLSIKYFRASAGSDYFIGMETERGFVAFDKRTSGYYCDDFNCYIAAANRKERLCFLNHARQMFADIEAAQDKRINDINKALKDCEGL